MLAALLLLSAAGAGAYQAYVPTKMSSRVSCMGASCKACAILEVKDHRSAPVTLRPCISVDFEKRDMAVHFTGSDNGTVVFEKDIVGESPYPVCYVPPAYHDLQVCLEFDHVNSIGNSMQVCTVVLGGIINNPPSAYANTRCFLADTQSGTIKHTTRPRDHENDKT